jgi:hypothetical protein
MGLSSAPVGLEEIFQALGFHNASIGANQFDLLGFDQPQQVESHERETASDIATTLQNSRLKHGLWGLLRGAQSHPIPKLLSDRLGFRCVGHWLHTSKLSAKSRGTMRWTFED